MNILTEVQTIVNASHMHVRELLIVDERSNATITLYSNLGNISSENTLENYYGYNLGPELLSVFNDLNTPSKLPTVNSSFIWTRRLIPNYTSGSVSYIRLRVSVRIQFQDVEQGRRRLLSTGRHLLQTSLNTNTTEGDFQFEQRLALSSTSEALKKLGLIVMDEGTEQSVVVVNKLFKINVTLLVVILVVLFLLIVAFSCFCWYCWNQKRTKEVTPQSKVY
jgi:hypothetical protein